jgi:dGTPase
MNNKFIALRQEIEAAEKARYAPFACFAADCGHREHAEAEDPYRTAFQRDRDRVIHSRAYRRLRGKTQVFVAHHGDHYRNRLTHTMEVTQLARDTARTLRINEDLAETVALAHDLGHTPFGHAGERAMSEVLRGFGLTFEHNLQSRRIVEVLEKKFPDFKGLNLSWAVRDGLKKHRNLEEDPADREYQGSLEAQLVDISDHIAYQNHDIDDSLRGGIVTLDELDKLELWQEAVKNTPAFLPEKVWISAVISSLIKIMIGDLLAETTTRLAELNPQTAEDIRKAPFEIAVFSEEMEKKNLALRRFLYAKFYTKEAIIKQTERGQQTVRQIFLRLIDKPEALPKSFREMIDAGERKEIVIKDFIAGMTDNFAIEFAKSLK